jgi:hypothetical protein
MAVRVVGMPSARRKGGFLGEYILDIGKKLKLS